VSRGNLPQGSNQILPGWSKGLQARLRRNAPVLRGGPRNRVLLRTAVGLCGLFGLFRSAANSAAAPQSIGGRRTPRWRLSWDSSNFIH